MNRMWRGVLILALLLSTAMCASNNGGGGNARCDPWSGWTKTGSTCDSRFWCFGKSQKGTYDLFEKTRQCRNGIQKMTRRDFVRCGC